MMNQLSDAEKTIDGVCGSQCGRGHANRWNSAAAQCVFELTEFRSDAKISAWARLNDRHARNAGHRWF
jgi:hypothetical protein